MCILFLAINQHPDYPLIVCANRDEFYARPTLDAHFWPEKPTLLAGRDLQAGGSWLGMTTQGNFAAITNIRTGSVQSKSKKSRGELVSLALQANSPINIDWLIQHSDQYNPFNLTYGPLNKLSCYNSLQKQQITLASGFHAISNGALDDVWPKMAKGTHRLEKLVSASLPIHNNELFAILKDRTQAEDLSLPNTGIPLDWERKLSSIFIRSAKYGTRSSCILLQHKNAKLEFIEQVYDEKGEKGQQKEFTLNLPK